MSRSDGGVDRRRFLRHAGLVGTGTILAGCTGGDGGTDETQDTPTGTATGSPSMEDPANTDLVYTTTITPNSLDPMKASDNLDSVLAHNVYDPLMYYSANTPPQLTSWVAEDFSVSDDKKTYTLSLRDDVTFHNGDSLTAEDVVYSTNRMLNMERGFSWIWAGILTSDGVRAVDETTVEMQLDRVFAPFPFTLPYLFVVNKAQVEANRKSEGQFGEFGDYGTAFLEENDAGSGPYSLQSRSRKQEVVLSKNEEWWNDFAEGNTFEQATVDMVSETSTVVGKMKQGQADISDQWLSLEAYDDLDSQDGITVSAEATFNPFYIFMHNKRPPFDDINVRKAFSYAFDYETAINDVLAGDSERLKGALPSAMRGHADDVTVYNQDLERAQSLLDQADYSVEEINSMGLTYTYVTGLTIEQNHGLLLQMNLQEIGIDLSIEKRPWTNITSIVENAGDSPDMLAIYLSFSYADPDTFLYPAWHSSQHGSWQSASWYENEEVDSMLTQARRVVDQDERTDMYKQAQRQIADDAPALFVANQARRFAINDRMKGFTDNGVTGYTHSFYRWHEGET